MFTTNIVWHDAAEELPEKSGNYLAIKRSGHITDLTYSNEHALFNACDWETEAEAKEYAIDCKYWAEMPKLPDTESEDE